MTIATQNIRLHKNYITMLPDLCPTQTNVSDEYLLSLSPRCSVLANIPETDLYRDRKDYLHVSIISELK